jgi:hypothetical protein
MIALAQGCGRPEQRHAMARHELAFERLGQEIRRAAPEAAVLAVGNPFTLKPRAAAMKEADESAMRGLKRGLGDGPRLLGVAYPVLKDGALENPHAFPAPPGASTPLSYLTAPGAWDRLLEEHPGANVLVSLIGIPADLKETRAWTQAEGPRWVLFLPDLSLIGSPEEVRAAFETGRVLAAVLRRPGAEPESEPLSDDAREEFDRRFIMVTAENATEVLQD